MMRALRLKVAAAAAWVLAGLPGTVEACSVCFGKTDSPLGKGLHWGVFVLLAFITVVLAAFGAFAVFLARRSMAVEREVAQEQPGGGAGL